MSSVYLVMYRRGRDESFQVKGAFSEYDKARTWAESNYGKFTPIDWEIIAWGVDSPGSAW